MLKTKWTNVLLISLIFLFSYLNIWWTYFAHKGNIQVLNLSKAYYWHVLGRWHSTQEDKKLLDNPHVYFDKPQNTILLYHNDFSKDSSANVIETASNKQLRINKDLQFSAPYSVHYNPSIKQWIRVSADFYCAKMESNFWRQALFTLKFMNKDQEVQTNSIKVHRFISAGNSQNIYLDAICPAAAWDKLTISFWNAESDKELLIDNLEVISFDD